MKKEPLIRATATVSCETRGLRLNAGARSCFRSWRTVLLAYIREIATAIKITGAERTSAKAAASQYLRNYARLQKAAYDS